jgi:hypothetical protein
LIPVRESAQGATFAVKVHPRARRNAVTGVLGEALKLALTAPPVEGKANEACLQYLAEVLGVPRAALTLLSGETSRQKLVRVAGVPAEEVRRRLAAALQ